MAQGKFIFATSFPISNPNLCRLILSYGRGISLPCHREADEVGMLGSLSSIALAKDDGDPPR